MRQISTRQVPAFVRRLAMGLVGRRSRGVLPGTIVVAGLAIALGIQPAHAQFSAGQMQSPTATNPASLGAPRVLSPAEVERQKQQRQPDALPGAAAQSDRVAPATPGAHIADPNEALFDAINRGDIASARDAIDRGADLDGHNVLGMTPLDLSVDLGRNNITFLLLSLRNGDSRPTGRATTQTAQGSAAAKAAAAKAPAKPRVATRAPSAPKPPVQTASAGQMAPMNLAGDGGTPNPSAGFLGFDNRR